MVSQYRKSTGTTSSLGSYFRKSESGESLSSKIRREKDERETKKLELQEASQKREKADKKATTLSAFTPKNLWEATKQLPKKTYGFIKSMITDSGPSKVLKEYKKGAEQVASTKTYQEELQKSMPKFNEYTEKLRSPSVSEDKKKTLRDYLMAESQRIEALRPKDAGNIQTPLQIIGTALETGLDVATLGRAGMIKKGIKTAAKAGIKRYARTTLEAGAIGASRGIQAEEPTVKGVAKETGMFAAGGAVLQGLGEKAMRLIRKSKFKKTLINIQGVLKRDLTEKEVVNLETKLAGKGFNQKQFQDEVVKLDQLRQVAKVEAKKLKIEATKQAAKTTEQVTVKRATVKQVAKTVVEPPEQRAFTEIGKATRKLTASLKGDATHIANRKKAEGYEMSAIKRKIEGNPTVIESQKARETLTRDFVGKKVKFEGKDVTVIKGNIFGKVQIQFKNGIKKVVEKRHIEAPEVTKADVLNKLREDGLNDLRGKASGVDMDFDKMVTKFGKEVKAPVIKVAKGGVAKPKIKSSEKITVTPTIKTPKLATGVKERAIRNKLISRLDKRFKDLPDYDKVNIKVQKEKAADIALNDWDKALRIAMGEESPPNGVLPESLFVAVEDIATWNKDIETLRKLGVLSGLTKEGSYMGQRIRMLAERNPYSSTSKIQQVVKEKVKFIEEKGVSLVKEKSKNIKEIKEKISLATPDEGEWNKFISNIEC